MAYEQRPNTGTMQRVPEEKRTSDKFPEFDGKLSITCPHCNAEQGWWLSAWVKEGKLGKFFSLALKPRERQPDRVPDQKPQSPKRPAYGEDDREIPF